MKPMSVFEGIGESIVALLVSAAAAVVVAIVFFVGVGFIGLKFFSGESSYGVGLAFGPPIAVVAGISTFILLFRKIRSV
jgi:hypothetical protein